MPLVTQMQEGTQPLVFSSSKGSRSPTTSEPADSAQDTKGKSTLYIF